MVFSSAVFLWMFLPIVFIVNFLLPFKFSNIFLLISSLFFYAWGEPFFVLLIILSILLNWLVGKAIKKCIRSKKIILIIGIILNLCVLVYYKYANFLVNIINSALNKEIIQIPDIMLPIGISFFTFQAISYIVDVYRGETEASDELINMGLYISFFPQLIAGPIVKYHDINKQIEKRNITGDSIAIGFRRFIYGLSKKVLISNIMGKTADIIFSYDVLILDGKTAWIGALVYTLQIYYDFSGYSDMAIGLGKMFGFDIPENFNYPYTSKSISEFWRRWHISLGTWFREYVYIPLGGNKKGKTRTYINLCIVFFLTGLWHGASFGFIAWGLFHGFFSILERIKLKEILDKSKVISHIYLLSTVILGWVIFRVENLKNALLYIKRMLMPWQYTEFEIETFNYMDKSTVIIFILAVIGMGFIQRAVPEKITNKWKYSIVEVLFCTGLLILCLASIASDTYNPFIYFQF